MEESRQAIIIEEREFWYSVPIIICLISVMILRFEKVGQFKWWLEESDKQQEVKDTGKEISLVSEKRLGCHSEHRWDTLWDTKFLSLEAKAWPRFNHKEHKSLWEDYKRFLTFPSLSSWPDFFFFSWASSSIIPLEALLMNQRVKWNMNKRWGKWCFW